MNLLLVDDEIFTLEALRLQILELPLSFDSVHTCCDVADAIGYLQNHSVSILICDIEMPGGSGFDLLKWIKEEKRSITSILLTCHADFQYAAEGIRYRVFDYLLKPVSSEQLQTVLESAVRFTLEQQPQAKQPDPAASYSRKEDLSSVLNAVGQITQMIDQHPECSYSRKELASRFFVNPDYLAKCFKREVGMSLPDYVSKKRMEKARFLLQYTEMQIQTVALKCGYQNFSYFAKCVKEETGFSPKEFRQKFSSFSQV